MFRPLLVGIFRKLGFDASVPSYEGIGDSPSCCKAQMTRKSRTPWQRMLPGSKKFKCYTCDVLYLLFLGVQFRVWN